MDPTQKILCEAEILRKFTERISSDTVQDD